ncbi:hypothetical protein [Actinotalea sp. C106]|uniref:hypothetical protein n=1 Tax=Actinotalea sp. C106 TaxID=2908644 RepID=UPI0020297368|nr:hypothetical protein [Actinotalea sp. C106]
MRKPIALALIPFILFGPSGCTGGMADDEEDACNRINAWDTGGREDERFDQAVAMARSALEESDDDSLVTLANELAVAPEADRVSKVEDFMSRCRDAGWVPPEG